MARKLHQLNGSNETFLEIKRVHPLEQMRMNGWDLSFWADGLSPLSETITPELVTDLAGNMWNGWSYMCVEIAAAGCCDWAEARRITTEMRKAKQEQIDRLKEEKEQLDGESASEDSASLDDKVPEAEVMPWDAMSEPED